MTRTLAGMPAAAVDQCGDKIEDQLAEPGAKCERGTTIAGWLPWSPPLPLGWRALRWHRSLLGDRTVGSYDDGVNAPSEVNTGQPVSQAGDATVGESVTRSGSTNGVHTGQVTGLDTTVNYEEGTASGLIDTDVCAEPGDSGGSMYDGATALGLTSGGSGDRESGGETFCQPAPAALSAYGLSLP